ncbi:MAG: RluA family pseudouridine synthase [Acidimicrobiales bacterium]
MSRVGGEIPQALDGERVDRAVSVLYGLARGEAAALIGAGGVRLSGRVVATRSSRVATGDLLEVDVPARADPANLEADASVEFGVVHDDAEVIVVDKPAGLVVHPGAGHVRGTLVQGLLARYPELAEVGPPERPGIVHRLDVGTSGLLAVARTRRARQDLVRQLGDRLVERRYLALVWGHLGTPTGVVDAPIGRSDSDPTRMAVSSRGREARTRYEVVQEFRDPVEVSLLRCALETGRTHQIRVHLAAIGHPVVGDPRYRGARSSLPVGRPFLHAALLAFDHPGTGRRVEFASALPPELEQVLDRLA